MGFQSSPGQKQNMHIYDVFFHKGVASISDGGEKTMKPLGGRVTLPFEY